MGVNKKDIIPPLPPIPENMGYDVDYEQLGKFIKGAEGFREKAYRNEFYNPDGTIDLGEPTIGYGSEFYEDGTRVQDGDTITKEAAETLWRHHIDKGITELMKVPAFQKMNRNQKSGIISMAYNLGPYFMESPNYPDLQAAIRSGNQEDIYKQMRRYTKAGNPLRDVQGLINRREDEINLMKTPLGNDDDGRYD